MPKDHLLTLVLVSGSLRSHSVNGAVIDTAAELASADAKAIVYRRLDELPHFNPDNDHDPLPEAVVDLRTQLKAADAVLISTPEYAGSLPGAFKNLLDWTVGGGSLYGLPVGWINPSAHGGSRDTYAALRIVLERTGAEIVEQACVDVAVPRDAIGCDGKVAGQNILAAIGRTVVNLLDVARGRRDHELAQRQPTN